MSADTDAIRDRLMDIASRRLPVVRERSELGSKLVVLRRELDAAVRDAHTASVPVAEIARLAGTTRRTVYAILNGG